MLILSFGCLRFLRESCLLYAFLLGYLPSIFLTFSAKPIDFYLQDSYKTKRAADSVRSQRQMKALTQSGNHYENSLTFP